jgi:fructose-1,6-bisphosphatase
VELNDIVGDVDDDIVVDMDVVMDCVAVGVGEHDALWVRVADGDTVDV